MNPPATFIVAVPEVVAEVKDSDADPPSGELSTLLMGKS